MTNKRLNKILIAWLSLFLVTTLWLTWLYNSDWLEQFNQQQNQRLTVQEQEAKRFAQTANQQACLTQALVKVDGCSGYSCSIEAGRFLKVCLAEAQTSANFCVDVPTFQDKPSEDDKAWAKDSCLKANVKSLNCSFVLRQQQQFCSQLIAQ